jgi:hypothetical protein
MDISYCKRSLALNLAPRYRKGFSLPQASRLVARVRVDSGLSLPQASRLVARVQVDSGQVNANKG